MPYYFGADMPAWDEFCEAAESGASGAAAPAMFQYVEPWADNKTVVSFPVVPGPELEEPVYDPKNWNDYFSKDQAYRSTRAVNEVSALAAKCRALGIVRVFGSYSGGNDEGFCHFHAVETSDGRRIGQSANLPASAPASANGDIDFEHMVDSAVAALMGNWGAGEYELYGAVTIDIGARTITDEKDRDAVFAADAATKSA